MPTKGSLAILDSEVWIRIHTSLKKEAEHYEYLMKVKEWSQRHIADQKKVSKRIVFYKLQIANLPDEAKKIIREGAHTVGTFIEGHFRDICKLSDPCIIAICEEIASSGKNRWNEERDLKKGGGIF